MRGQRSEARGQKEQACEAAKWELMESGANLLCGPLVGRVEVDGRGVQLLVATWNGQPSDAFGALITGGPGPRPAVIEIAETYVRGCDFVTRYVRSQEFPVAPQFYWRAAFHKDFDAAQVEMILSVQTDLLDSNPEVTISSVALESRLFYVSGFSATTFREVRPSGTAIAVEAGTLKEHLFVLRNEMLGLSYAQMVHPSDFVAATIRCEEGRPPLVESTLFPESLEKGVIRRGRIGGGFLPAEKDLEIAVKLAKKFVEEPLPLTA